MNIGAALARVEAELARLHLERNEDLLAFVHRESFLSDEARKWEAAHDTAAKDWRAAEDEADRLTEALREVRDNLEAGQPNDALAIARAELNRTEVA